MKLIWDILFFILIKPLIILIEIIWYIIYSVVYNFFYRLRSINFRLVCKITLVMKKLDDKKGWKNFHPFLIYRNTRVEADDNFVEFLSVRFYLV